MLGMAVSLRGASFSRRRGLTKDAAHEFVEEPCVLRTASPSSSDKVWLDLQLRAEFPKDRYGDSKHSIPSRQTDDLRLRSHRTEAAGNY